MPVAVGDLAVGAESEVVIEPGGVDLGMSQYAWPAAPSVGVCRRPTVGRGDCHSLRHSVIMHTLMAVGPVGAAC